MDGLFTASACSVVIVAASRALSRRRRRGARAARRSAVGAPEEADALDDDEPLAESIESSRQRRVRA